MTTKLVRKIVKIDESKCNGCGACAIACAEGALKIIDGKAKLVSETYCDGLGACLGECPQGAITIEERAAEEFSEEAVHEHLMSTRHVEEKLPCGCPGHTVTQFTQCAGCANEEDEESEAPVAVAPRSRLTHWPVQLTLVPPSAPFLRHADIVLTADCVPFAYAGFHQELLKDHALLVACPKLDDFGAHLEKLVQIVCQAEPKSVTVVHMEVPCCSGLVHMAKRAIAASGKNIPFKDITIGVRGDRLS